jgi:hypothetical protein
MAQAKKDAEKKSNEQGVAEGGFDNASPMTKDSQRADKIRSLKNLIAIAKEQGRGVRVQELELELKKLEGVAEGVIGRTIAKGKDWLDKADGNPNPNNLANYKRQEKLDKRERQKNKDKKEVKESYWDKLQDERNSKLNSLINELKESLK